MEARAIAKTVRIAPRKARLVVDLVRNKSVIEADKILAENPQSGQIIPEIKTVKTTDWRSELYL